MQKPQSFNFIGYYCGALYLGTFKKFYHVFKSDLFPIENKNHASYCYILIPSLQKPIRPGTTQIITTELPPIKKNKQEVYFDIQAKELKIPKHIREDLTKSLVFIGSRSSHYNY